MVAGTERQERVFNITVDTVHEYFANNILRANCDALRYSMLNCLTIAKEDHSSAMTSANREPSRDIEPARTI